MILTAALLFVLAQDPPKAPQPLYDGAQDFAKAIEAAAKDDPAYIETVRPFATGYWLWRVEQIKDFDGDWIKQELILCGKMIEYWEPELGKAIRQFALLAVLEDPNRDFPPLLSSDLRLTYVNRMGEYGKDKQSVQSALFDAGVRLAELTSHLVFAEFVDVNSLKTNAGPAIRACGKYPDDKPKAPADIRARVASIGTMAGTIPFTVDTMKEVGYRVARALATQVPENHRWKVPPDPPKIGGLA